MKFSRNTWFNLIIAALYLGSVGCSDIPFFAKEVESSSEGETQSSKVTEDEPTKEIIVEKTPVVEEEPVVEIIYEKLTPTDEIVLFASAADVDKNDIADCLFNLDSPFNLANATLEYRRIEFEKITGTLAIALEDTVATDEPQIVLIRSLETIGSDLIYKLMNPNAYYCFKNIDSVGTDLKLHLHCEARISETTRWTDDKWKTTSQTLEDAFVYLSARNLKGLVHESPEGASCIENRK